MIGVTAASQKVHLTLLQGSPREIAELLETGQADVGIATESLDSVQELASFPFYSWRHAVTVPEGHPLLALETVTLGWSPQSALLANCRATKDQIIREASGPFESLYGCPAVPPLQACPRRSISQKVAIKRPLFR